MAATRRMLPDWAIDVSVGVVWPAILGVSGHRGEPDRDLAPLLHLRPVMAYQSTLDAPDRDTNAFYRRTLHVLSDARVPFLVGGSHAILNYTGIVRETKDFDLFVRRADVDKALEALGLAGYWTQITFPHWLAKARQGNDHV